jgi:hypothetical protein
MCLSHFHLKGVECLCMLISLGEGIILKQVMQGPTGRAIALYKSSIIPSQTQETSELCDRLWLDPILNSLNLGWICGYSLAIDDMTQVCHLVCCKDTLANFYSKVVSS